MKTFIVTYINKDGSDSSEEVVAHTRKAAKFYLKKSPRVVRIKDISEKSEKAACQ